MKQEFETKVLDIDVMEIDKKLISLGAKKKPRTLTKRYIYFIERDEKNKKYKWIRLRQEWGKPTIAYKQRNDAISTETYEEEVEVEDFNKTHEILNKIQFTYVFYQECYRTQYTLGNIEFSIDEWPKLKPHIEIEGKTKKDMEKGLELLGLNGKEIGDVIVKELYKKIGIDPDDGSVFQFEVRR